MNANQSTMKFSNDRQFREWLMCEHGKYIRSYNQNTAFAGGIIVSETSEVAGSWFTDRESGEIEVTLNKADNCNPKRRGRPKGSRNK